jgi:membrane dipeptidase
MSSVIPVVDGHNDALLRLFLDTRAAVERRFIEGDDRGHIDLPRAMAGGLAGGLFAIFAPSDNAMRLAERIQGAAYDLPLPPAPVLSGAQAVTVKMVSILARLERESAGRIAICRDVAAIRRAMKRNVMATVLHIEGAEAIDPDFHMLDVLYAAGLRSIGIVWSRANIFGHGVPFRFPGLPDTGPGLTDLGKELVRACNRLGILIDLSHLNEKGFWDVAALSNAPLVATHSNVHDICPTPRNLTNRQLDAIRESGGVVGLNFAAAFLRPDGATNADTDLEIMIRHLDAMIERLGEDGVALGSDFDGAVIPKAIGDASGLPRLLDAMLKHGFGRPLVRKIAQANWLRVLERTWGGQASE